MKPELTPLRKAAILLASLDDETAESLMAQMPKEHAARVRRELAELGDIDPVLEQQVAAEFRSRETTAHDPYSAGIELDARLAERLAQPVLPDAYAPTSLSAAEPPPFRFLHEAETDTLVEYLQRERPQTIAVVVSHLSPGHAADVIGRLAPTVQAQVLRRLAELDETDSAVLRDIERHLESRISEQIRSRDRRQAGLQALDAIVSAAGADARRDLVRNLIQHDSALAEKLGFDGPRRSRARDAARTGSYSTSGDELDTGALAFADVARLDQHRLRAILDAAPAEVVVLALAGADADFVDRAAASLSAKRGKLLRRALAHLGPTRLSDVEEAQESLARLATDLELGGAGNQRLVGTKN
jgi:flagellar motor switch protein FliG